MRALVRNGFSLVEVIAVLVILGILASVAIMSVTNDDFDPMAETEGLKTALRYAQARAMADVAPAGSNTSWGIQINANSYTLLHPGFSTPVLPGANSATFTLRSPHVFTAGTGTVNFDAAGQPYSGTALLNTPYVIRIDTATQITINAVTGFIQ